MDKELKTKLCSQEKWMRLMFMVLFSIIFFIATWCMFIVGAIAVIQFVFALLVGKPNKQLLSFSDSFSQYVYQIVKFLTYVTEEKPFPFASWPHPKHTNE